MTNQKTVLYLLVAAFIMVTAVFGALRFAGMTGGEDVPAVAMNKADVEKIVRNYLLEHPEVIFEAVDAMKNKEEDERLVKMKDKAKAHQTALYSEAEPLVAGNPKGDVTIVEFFDYRCPYCRKVKKTVVDLLKQDGNIRLILKEFPILSPESEMAAQVAIAAAAQGKYWEVHMAFMGAEDLTQERIFTLAKEAGADIERIKAELKNPKIEKRLTETQNLARALGIDATPTFFIGDEPSTGGLTLEELKKAVAAARKAKQS
ncbi:MAG: DsbA family protein [Alphaproteobacteria bacterium]|nr:DsbA family protein [Alphaproteobacteria bacterium]